MGKTERNAEERQRAQADSTKAAQSSKEGRKRDSLGRMQSPTSAQAGKANMKPLDELDKVDPERAKAIRRKGQAAQMAKARQRKAIREIYEELLAQKVPDSVTNEAVARYAEQTGKKSVTAYECLAIAQLLEAQAGNTKAAAFVRDSVGDKPVEQVQVSEAVTDGDRSLMAKLEARLQHKDKKPEA